MFYLVKKNKEYYLRIRITKDVRQFFPFSEVKKSLHTPTYTQANALAKIFVADVERGFMMIRSNALSYTGRNQKSVLEVVANPKNVSLQGGKIFMGTSMRFMIRIILTLMTLAFSLPTFAKDPICTVEGIVTKVFDGDTVAIKDDLGTKLNIRLYGIDCPETEKSNKRTGRVSIETKNTHDFSVKRLIPTNI